MRVLVVEDDVLLAEVLERGLAAHGRQVLMAETGEDAELIVRVEPVDLVILDITLPGIDGYETLSRIRRLRRDLPVIMLTARDDIGSKITAFDGGADDYLTKPFVLDELLARIRALTRRLEQATGSALEWGDLRVDLVSRRVQRGGREINLSRREFMLLEYFARNPHRLLSRTQILAAAWEHDFEGESNIVDVYVRYLRAKLDTPGEPSLISTVRGAGYRFEPPA
jgi:DNA-binding response OmpR family regulator